MFLAMRMGLRRKNLIHLALDIRQSVPIASGHLGTAPAFGVADVIQRLHYHRPVAIALAQCQGDLHDNV